jgi:hypothetical protein
LVACATSTTLRFDKNYNALGSTGGEGEPDVKLTGTDSTISVACRRIEQNIWEAAYTPNRLYWYHVSSTGDTHTILLFSCGDKINRKHCHVHF